jgi:hypothetical protein
MLLLGLVPRLPSRLSESSTMSLIELIMEYRHLLKANGRVAAASWLTDVCDVSVQEAIINTVNDNAQFIDAENQVIFGIYQ